MRWFKTLLWMAAFLFVPIFAIQNNQDIAVRFSLSPVLDQEWISPHVPLFVAILTSVLLGVLIGAVADFFRGIQLRRTVTQHQKTIERLEKDIQSLRRPQGE